MFLASILKFPHTSYSPTLISPSFPKTKKVCPRAPKSHVLISVSTWAMGALRGGIINSGWQGGVRGRLSLVYFESRLDLLLLASSLYSDRLLSGFLSLGIIFSSPATFGLGQFLCGDVGSLNLEETLALNILSVNGGSVCLTRVSTVIGTPAPMLIRRGGRPNLEFFEKWTYFGAWSDHFCEGIFISLLLRPLLLEFCWMTWILTKISLFHVGKEQDLAKDVALFALGQYCWFWEWLSLERRQR
ncbi:hypothetical protein Acr_00g0086520 [Actinidia rufa]|uniref:Uncharacterized protein n=1 Tax=Actinidia rufa TaxID=165716 RepID=A0A7J0DYB3_9ERIC|nr:hypothetical protein Acr_00g0086520 [Actinidia rufa]